jgi:hypothetical protein
MGVLTEVELDTAFRGELMARVENSKRGTGKNLRAIRDLQDSLVGVYCKIKRTSFTW